MSGVYTIIYQSDFGTTRQKNEVVAVILFDLPLSRKRRSLVFETTPAGGISEEGVGGKAGV